MWQSLTLSDVTTIAAFLITLAVLFYAYSVVRNQRKQVKTVIPKDYMYVPRTDLEIYSFLTEDELAVTSLANVNHVMNAIARANLQYAADA